MQIPVLIEAMAGNGYRASAGDPFGLIAFGTTREETLRNLEELIEKRLASGAELTNLIVKPTQHPLSKYAGTWREDDPLLGEWKKAVEEYRQQIDQDAEIP